MNTFLEHLTPEDLDDIGRELDAIRDESWPTSASATPPTSARS